MHTLECCHGKSVVYTYYRFLAVLLDRGQFAEWLFDKVSRTQAILIKFRVAKNTNVAMDVTQVA